MNFSNRQSGRVKALAATSLAVIAMLWLGAGALKQQPEALSAANAVSQASDDLATDTERASAAIEELKVSAPRLTAPELNFEQPTLEIAVTKPEDPKQFWQDAGS